MASLAKKPVEWERKPIIKLFEVKTGTTPSTKNPEYWNGGAVLWYTPADLSKVNERVYVGFSERRVTERALQDRNLNVVPKNSIILATRAPVGTLGLTTTEATFNQGCKGLVPRDSTQTEPLFYYYYLTMERRALENQSSGSTFKELPKPRLEAFLVPAPAYKEQHKIASILYTLDRAIQKSKVATEETERLKQGMMRKLLTKGIGHAEFKNEIFGRIPKVWTTDCLGNCSERPEYGLTASANERSVGPKFLRITDITDTGVNWSEVPFCICSSEEEEKYALKKGDLVFARIGATTGKSYFISETRRAVFASYLIRIRCKDIILPEYLGYFTQSHHYWEYINKTKTGQLKGGINIPIIRSLPVLIPPIAEQKQIVVILSTVDRKLDLQRQRTAALERLKQGLMNDLLTGKRRVVA